MLSQFPVACSVLVASLASAVPLAPAQSLSACIGVAGAAVSVSVSARPLLLRLRTGADCTVVATAQGTRP